MDWEMDEKSGKGTWWLHRGGGVDHSRSAGGNTVNFDGVGQVVSVVFANPVATMNLSMAGAPIGQSEFTAFKNLVSHFPMLAKKPAGA